MTAVTLSLSQFLHASQEFSSRLEEALEVPEPDFFTVLCIVFYQELMLQPKHEGEFLSSVEFARMKGRANSLIQKRNNSLSLSGISAEEFVNQFQESVCDTLHGIHLTYDFVASSDSNALGYGRILWRIGE